MKYKKIYLGNANSLNVYFDLEAATNKHMILFGQTGSGKSVQAQNIILDIVRNGGTVVVPDMHSVFSHEQIFHMYQKELETYLHEIDAYNVGIPCNLFTPVRFTDGTVEQPCDTVGAITDILVRTTKMGIKQKGILRDAIQEVMDSGLYEELGIKALDYQLNINKTYETEYIKDKLYPILSHNVFRPGASFIKPGAVNVIRLEKFDLSTQEIITQLLLSYLWRMASVLNFKKDGLFVFLDEFHNLISGRKCILSQIIAEGRKFNLNLILATQQFPSGTQRMAQDFMQSGLILLFKPCSDQVNIISKFINYDKKREWAEILKSLKKGEFIAVGKLAFNNSKCTAPLKISNVM